MHLDVLVARATGQEPMPFSSGTAGTASKRLDDPTAASLTQPQGAASPGRPGGAPPAVAPKPRTPTPKPPQAAPGPERPSRWVAHRRRAHRAKRNDVAFPEPPSARPRAGRRRVLAWPATDGATQRHACGRGMSDRRSPSKLPWLVRRNSDGGGGDLSHTRRDQSGGAGHADRLSRCRQHGPAHGR